MRDFGKGYYVNLRILDNGDLEITRTIRAVEQHDHFLALPTDRALEELFEDWLCNGWEFIPPEKLRALTAAPILSNAVVYNDRGTVEYVSEVWWFPNYQMENEVETLLESGKVIFTRAHEEVIA